MLVVKHLWAKNTKIVVVSAVVLTIILVTGILYYLYFPKYVTAAETSSAELTEPDDPTTKRYIQPDILDLKARIDAYIKQQKDADISLHMEYLPTGQSIDVQPGKYYRMMSLAKLPEAMWIDQAVEQGRLDASKPLVIQQKDIDSRYGSLWRKGIGYKISLAQAIKLSIVDSDNTAINLLIDAFASARPQTQVTEQDVLFDSLLTNRQNLPYSTTQNYSQYLECLYDSCLLTTADSHTILSLMTQTDESALRDGVGPGAIVADKFGILEESGNPNVYNDCGITYTSNGNYILCIMASSPTTHSRQFSVDLSRITFQAIAHP